MMMDTREKVYRNVKALAAIHGEPLNEVEKAIGRNPGYLSRKSAKIDIDMLVTLAKRFEMPVDDLINGDWEHELAVKKAVVGFKEATYVLRCYFKQEGIETLLANTFAEMEDV